MVGIYIYIYTYIRCKYPNVMYVLFFLNLSISDAGALSSTRSTHEENIDVI